MADLTITAANVQPGLSSAGAQFASGTAGATITAGQSVYKDDADSNEYKACDADAAATADCDGIALHGASDGQPLKVQTGGPMDLGATLTTGETYVVSTTPGGIAPIGDLLTGDYVTILGVATAADTLTLPTAIVNSGVAKA